MQREAAGLVLILGCGYVGRRVARRLIARGVSVIGTNREGVSTVEGMTAVRLRAERPDEMAHLSDLIDCGATFLHSIPLWKNGEALEDCTRDLFRVLARKAPRRVVYLSTTGVYGKTISVDEKTLPAPRTPRETLRVDAEQVVMAGAWSSLVLRPAAIYGPYRGVHASLRSGTFSLAADDPITSRVHVDDLAELTSAALLSDVGGAFPVADDEPCTSREVVDYCHQLMKVPAPAEVVSEALGETRRSGRRVSGSAIFRELGVRMLYRSYREGIRASLAAEELGGSGTT